MRRSLFVIMSISTLAGSALAHPGHGALSSNQAAHWFVDHPVLTTLAGVAIAAGLGLFLRRRARR